MIVSDAYRKDLRCSFDSGNCVLDPNVVQL